MISLLRAIKFAFQDMGRNISLSFMTVLILILMLLSVNTLLIIRTLTSEAIGAVKNQIDVSIYFINTATNEQVQEVQKYVESFPEVTEITLRSREEVLKQFQEKHADNPEIIEALKELGENPLGPTMVVKTKEPGNYEKVIKALQVPEYENFIEAKTFEDTEIAIKRIDTITTQVERFSLALSTFFAFIAFLIIFNTVRVAIYTQRIEISIKKLVGATNWFIRAPYIIEAFIFSLLSTLATYVLVIMTSKLIDPYIQVIFHKENILTNFFSSNILLLFGMQFGAVLLLTIITSFLAMRRHLRV